MIQGTLTIAGISLTIASLLSFLCASGAVSTVSASASTATLPAQVFWDNDWASDLRRVGGDSGNGDSVSSPTEFPPFLDNPYVISGQGNLDEIGDDPESIGLTDLYASNKEIEVKTWNGSWIRNVYLPIIVDKWSLFQLTCGSGWAVNVHYNNGEIVSVGYNQKLVLMYIDEEGWINEDQFNTIATPAPTQSPTREEDNPNPPLLEGTVLFAQNQIIPSKNRVDGDTTQPHLTAMRKTLVMMRPHLEEDKVVEESVIEMTVRDKDGTVLASSIAMNHPNEIPKQEGWVEMGDGIDADNIEFPKTLTDPFVVQGQSNLNEIGNDESASDLKNLINQQGESEIEIKTQDGSWIKHIYLPNPEDIVNGDDAPTTVMVQITCNSGYNVNVHYPKTGGGLRNRMLSRGQKIVVMLVNGSVWVADGDLEHNQYVFGHGFYTATLDLEWVAPGMTLEFSATVPDYVEERRVGVLDDIDIGGMTELILTTIDAGFLTEPRNQFTFKDDPVLHQEYWETAPISRLIVAQYESMHLTEIVLPNGKRYTEVSDTDGGWHSGDMRQYIGKILLSHGIDMANYGIHSSLGSSESSHPFTSALLAAHNTVGMYQNGRQVHGGSGGNGMITLDSSVGNEFSHEVGHNYGLGHYVDGFAGSVHRPASEINSGWGWDSAKNVFVPNFASADSGLDQCVNDECQDPFLDKYQYGKDSMAGGSPQWKSANRYTLYTPNTNRIIQEFLERKAVFDATSTTGFRKWDPYTREMKEFVNPSNGGKAPEKHRVAVTTIVGYYDPDRNRNLDSYVYPAMHGAFGFVYSDDGEGDIDDEDCKLVVETTNGGSPYVYRLFDSIDSNGMNKFHVNVATEDEPHRASIHCDGELIADRALDGPISSSSLSYTVTGAPYNTEDDNEDDNEQVNPISLTKSPTSTQTSTPTSSITSNDEEVTLSPTKPECKDVVGKIQFKHKQKVKNWSCKKIEKKKKCRKTELSSGDKLWSLCPVYCRKKIPEKKIENLWCVHSS